MWSCGRISEGPGWRPRSKGSAHRASSDSQSSLRVCGIWQVSLTVSERTWPSVVGMGGGLAGKLRVRGGCGFEAHCSEGQWREAGEGLGEARGGAGRPGNSDPGWRGAEGQAGGKKGHVTSSGELSGSTSHGPGPGPGGGDGPCLRVLGTPGCVPHNRGTVRRGQGGGLSERPQRTLGRCMSCMKRCRK